MISTTVLLLGAFAFLLPTFLMAAPDARGMIHVGYDILTTTVNATTKKILAQLGDVYKQETDTDNAEWWQHVGLASRPPKPEAGRRAAQAAVFRAGDHDVVFASQDLRGLELYGNLDHGETCLYAPGESGTAQARVLLKKDGSLNLFTRAGNSSGGAGMGIFVNVDGSVSIVSSTGGAFLVSANGDVRAFNANGAVQVAADGTVKVSSATKVGISAPAVVLGGSAAAAPVVNSTDLTSLVQLITTALAATVGNGGAAAATAFSTAASSLIATMQTTKRTSAD